MNMYRIYMCDQVKAATKIKKNKNKYTKKEC